MGSRYVETLKIDFKLNYTAAVNELCLHFYVLGELRINYPCQICFKMSTVDLGSKSYALDKD